MNANALYFVECHYVTSDDAQFNTGVIPAINGLNNSTYRRVTIANVGAAPAFAAGSVVRTYPVQAWRDSDATVQVTNFDYTDSSLGAPGITARFVVGCKVTNNGNGTYHYEYA